MEIHRQKIEQASRLVKEHGLGAWLLFVRETAAGSDPSLPLILEGGLTWQSVLLVCADGESVAIVGNYDAEPLDASGDWTHVQGYVQDIRPALLEALERAVPADLPIGVNYSTGNDKADGISHGMWLLLEEYLRGTPFEDRLVSAEALVARLRGQKTAGELSLIKEAIVEGDRLFHEIGRFARLGTSERAVFNYVQGLMRDRGLGHAWDPAGDPIVNSGPQSMVGHGVPSDSIVLEEGHVFHVDLGVQKDGYCSDVQRCWYVGRNVPPEVQTALNAANRAIDAGAAALRPGVAGWEVDAAGRESIVSSGYAEYMHALGHQVGRSAHDGGTILGPRWERYGSTPFGEIREDEVYTLELGVDVEGRGYLGVEEMVVVGRDRCEFLTQRQEAIWTLEGV